MLFGVIYYSGSFQTRAAPKFSYEYVNCLILGANNAQNNQEKASVKQYIAYLHPFIW